MCVKPNLSVAPMMDRTDKHCRYLLRLISPHIKLYTEMITTYAIIHGDKDYLLKFNPAEKYIALQLGGSDPQQLSQSAKIGEAYGYDEINLNVGCPSSRVSSGYFGVCLMLNPEVVANCFRAMREVVTIPVTIKCRIGVDQHDSYQFLADFIQRIADAGCNTFIIHARKAWLKGLSPKQNRELPPLNYARVKQIKDDFPNLKIILNGGIKSAADISQHYLEIDGVMIGREAYANPFCLAEFEQKFYKNQNVLTRAQVINKFIIYVSEQLSKGVKLNNMTRHLLGLFQGQVGAKIWRQYLSQHAHRVGAGTEVIEKALALTVEVQNNARNYL